MSAHSAEDWVDVCAVTVIVPDSGVCALVGGEQVAVFRLRDERLYAIGNVDPFTGAAVLSRGIVGDHRGVPKVASPLHKQSFDLATGTCLSDARVAVPAYSVRVRDGIVQVAARAPRARADAQAGTESPAAPGVSR